MSKQVCEFNDPPGPICSIVARFCSSVVVYFCFTDKRMDVRTQRVQIGTIKSPGTWVNSQRVSYVFISTVTTHTAQFLEVEHDDPSLFEIPF